MITLQSGIIFTIQLYFLSFVLCWLWFYYYRNRWGRRCSHILFVHFILYFDFIFFRIILLILTYVCLGNSLSMKFLRLLQVDLGFYTGKNVINFFVGGKWCFSLIFLKCFSYFIDGFVHASCYWLYFIWFLRLRFSGSQWLVYVVVRISV